MIKKRKVLPTATPTVSIEKLGHDARGITHLDGKIVFIDNALIGEQLKFQYTSTRSKFDEGVAIEILSASADRQDARCPHATLCGGCSLQHMKSSAQIREKEKTMLEQLAHFGNVTVPEILSPLTADEYHYRRKARMGAKFVEKKGGALVGFREKRSNFLAAISECHVLHKTIADQIPRLRELIAACDARLEIPQLEVAVGDHTAAIIVRHLKPLSDADHQRWITFSQDTGIELYYQPKGLDSVHKVWPEDKHERLSYRLPDFDLEMRFHPLDFTQVNFDINRQMVTRAIDLLDVQPEERVLDLFCGLGNFTLPLARRAREVVGVEGDDSLVQRGIENATHNQVANARFYGADLTKDITAHAWAKEGFDKILIDPPRSGALEVVRELARFKAKRIVYVSCNPATLARDAGELTKLGYRLSKAGVMDMFPHTTHVESMAVFERH